ncbi:MAG: GNAT family N-acetyltransferase [Bowdeniella nasicola]|nr:GNAT family N-acetyltransferase [Bowdeniella nasicola]
MSELRQESETYSERPDRRPFFVLRHLSRLADARRAERAELPEPCELLTVGGLTWRTLSREDTDTLAALISHVETSERAPFRTTRAEVRELFDPGYHIDSRGGYDAEGRLRAFGFVRIPRLDVPVLVATLYGSVDPEMRERNIGADLLRWQILRAREMIMSLAPHGGGYLQVIVDEGQRDIKDLLTRHGFIDQGEIIQMRRSLTEELPAADAPSHIRIEPWSDELDDAVRLAHEEAFSQSGGDSMVSVKEWGRARAALVPEWSFIALDRSSDRARVAGYVLASKWEEDWDALGWSEGYIEAIGVLEEWRGQGVAKSLLSHSMRAMRADSMEYAGIDADSQNPTGAQTVFELIGFEYTHATTRYVLDVPPLEA